MVEVHVDTYHITIRRITVFIGGKSGQAIFEHKNAHWVTGGDKGVDSQVKLKPINQQWLEEKKDIGNVHEVKESSSMGRTIDADQTCIKAE